MVIAGSTNFSSNKRSLRYQSSKTSRVFLKDVMELKHESITLSSLVRRALNPTCSILICFSREGGGVLAPGFLRSLYRRVQGVLRSLIREYAWLHNSQNGRQHKGVVGNSGNRFKKFNTRRNCQKIRFILFAWFLLASCVVIFPIRCDLSDFLYPEFISTNKLKGEKTRDKGNRLNGNGSGR